MNNSPLEAVIVPCAAVPPAPRWATGLKMRIPERLTQALAAGPLESTLGSEVRQIAADLRLRAAYTPVSPMSSRLPVGYHAIPRPARLLVANALGRIQRSRQPSWCRFPGWPLDLSADFVFDLSGERGIVFERTPVLVSHDIDSPEGLRNLVTMFLPIEEANGARSSNYIVPCAWPVDHGRVEEVRQRGHEIGVHGYDHANRTPYCNEGERRKRLAAGRAFGDRYGATGYRAPSLCRTEALLASLAPLYCYDTSIPTSGGPFPVPNNGCASARPWRIGTLWEIPLTMPRDGSLRFLGHSPAQIGRLWHETAETIGSSGGVVTLLTHCEAAFSGNPAMLETYRGFLEWVRQDERFVFMRMDELAAQLENRYAQSA